MVASKHTALIIWMRSHILHHSLILIYSNFRCLSFWTMSHIISSTNLSNIKLVGGAEVLILVLAWLVWHTHLLCLTSAENVSLIISGFVMLWMGDNMVDTCLILTLHLSIPKLESRLRLYAKNISADRKIWMLQMPNSLASHPPWHDSSPPYSALGIDYKTETAIEETELFSSCIDIDNINIDYCYVP